MVRKFTLALLLSGSVLHFRRARLAQDAAPVSKLVEAVNIPHEKFTLPNGLTVSGARRPQGTHSRGFDLVWRGVEE